MISMGLKFFTDKLNDELIAQENDHFDEDIQNDNVSCLIVLRSGGLGFGRAINLSRRGVLPTGGCYQISCPYYGSCSIKTEF